MGQGNLWNISENSISADSVPPKLSSQWMNKFSSVEPWWVRRCEYAACALWPYLASGHSALQQVNIMMSMMRIINIAIATYDDGDEDDDVFFRPHGCLWRGKKWLCKVFSLTPRQPVTRDDVDHDGDDHHHDHPDDTLFDSTFTWTAIPTCLETLGQQWCRVAWNSKLWTSPNVNRLNPHHITRVNIVNHHLWIFLKSQHCQLLSLWSRPLILNLVRKNIYCWKQFWKFLIFYSWPMTFLRASWTPALRCELWYIDTCEQ